MSYIYVAGPYTSPKASVRHQRYMQHMAYVAELVNMGRAAYSPIVHFHAVAINHTFPYTADFWGIQLRTMLESAASLHLLQLPGWEKSKGVQQELIWAKELDLPIRFIKGVIHEPHSLSPLGRIVGWEESSA